VDEVTDATSLSSFSVKSVSVLLSSPDLRMGESEVSCAHFEMTALWSVEGRAARARGFSPPEQEDRRGRGARIASVFTSMVLFIMLENRWN
jgi:hypothetical protein